MREILFFIQNILKYYEHFGRYNLPWRKSGVTPYEVWVSEILLQQTQAKRVVDYYTRFIERFPDVERLAKTSWQVLLNYYRGLGYYRRAENMQKTARIIATDYLGKFPCDEKELRELPGIGTYTAQALLSFAFHENVLPIDTNIQKVLGRYFMGDKLAKLSPHLIEKLKYSGSKLPLGMMDLSSEICLPRPKCEACPLASRCVYRLTNGRREVTKKAQPTLHHFPNLQAHVYLWLHKEHRVYYSSSMKRFTPFHLKPPYNTRTAIKEHFKKYFDLELSVRPPHKKIFIKNIPCLFINAQILLGKPTFRVFEKEEMKTPQPK